MHAESFTRARVGNPWCLVKNSTRREELDVRPLNIYIIFAHVVGHAQDLCLLIVSMRKLQVNFELHEYHYHYNRVQLSPVRSVGSEFSSTRT